MITSRRKRPLAGLSPALPIHSAHMNLEDHVGDVIRKARAMTNVPADAAAKAAGLSAEQLAELEGSGKSARKPDFHSLASLICPGHGPLTTVAQERASNPFF